MSQQKIERLTLASLSDANEQFEAAMERVVAEFFDHIGQCEGGEGGPLATKDGSLEAVLNLKIVIRTNPLTLGTDATVGVDLKLPSRKTSKVALLARPTGFLVPEDEVATRQLKFTAKTGPKEIE